MRGAWGQRSDGGTSRVMYLRGDGTAWSAVAVTYASDSGRTVTGLVLKWLTGESRNDSSSRFVLGDGDLDYATIGIRASDAAQRLLGKAKSLKSVGGLEQFVREFMLDEPDSLARLPEALKQIDPLVEARELLAVAPMVRAFTDHVRLAQCPTQVATLDGTIDQLENEYEDVTRSLNLAKAEADSLNTQINGSSANLAPLQSQLNAAETEAEQVERRRAAYEDLLTACNRWAAGRFDAGVFKENWRFSTKVESQYLARATPPSPPTSASLTSSTLLDLFDVAEDLALLLGPAPRRRAGGAADQ